VGSGTVWLDDDGRIFSCVHLSMKFNFGECFKSTITSFHAAFYERFSRGNSSPAVTAMLVGFIPEGHSKGPLGGFIFHFLSKVIICIVHENSSTVLLRKVILGR